MKRKTLVCQFASPLDVDVHNTPQAILLEGKYWKRKCNVIKAEYKKWRRFNVNKALGATNIVDTTSELDFLEWSPISNDLFMITDNMPTDTLFSTLGQYPFPDSREIARGAGRADFIQPSLGPLQPNLDDLMELDLDFLNFPRLAPVPEEATDDLLKAIDYNYPLGSNLLTNTGATIQEVTEENSSAVDAQPAGQPMPLGTGTSVVVGSNLNQSHQQQPSQQPTAIQYSAKIFAQALHTSGSTASSSSATSSVVGFPTAQQISSALDSYLSTLGSSGASGGQQTLANAQQIQPVTAGSLPVSNSSGGDPREEITRGGKSKFSRVYAKHNYDSKYPPTPHQTMAYNMVSQPHLGQPAGTATNSGVHSTAYNIAGGYPSSVGPMSHMTTGSGTSVHQPTSQGAMHLLYNHSGLQNATPANPVNLSGGPTGTNLAVNSGSNGGGGSCSSISSNSSSTQQSAMSQGAMLQAMNSKLLTHSQSLPVPVMPQTKSSLPQPRSTSMPTAPNYNQMLASSQHSPPGSLHASQSGSSYKSYHGHQSQPYKIPSQTVGAAGGSYGSGARAMTRHSSPPHGTVLQPTSALGSGLGSSGATVGLSHSLEQSQQQLQDLQLQQQQQLHQQQQLQQSQHQHSLVSTSSAPGQQQQQQQQQQHNKRHPPHPTKEMIRSNSLPINATFQLPPKEMENFAMPRYQSQKPSSSKMRSRSHSMIMKQQTGASVAGASGLGMGCTGGNIGASAGGSSLSHYVAPTTLHTTSSEPMLNVTNSALLAQLLTTNNASTLLSKQSHSASSSAISTLIQSQQQQQHQSNPFQPTAIGGSTLSPSSSQHQLQQLHQQLQQPTQKSHLTHQQQHHHNHQLSSSSGPGTSSGGMRPQNASSSSVLSFASSAGMSLSQQSLSPESAHDTDGPLSPTGVGSGGGSVSAAGGPSPSSSGGIVSKFPRNDNQRRTGHIHAEQKRRYNIKNGFDTLHSLIPQLQQNPSAKLSKAAMLQKGADYIKQLRSERTSANDQMDALRKEIEQLNNSLSNLQTALPASGAPVSRQRTGRVKELYQQYVRQRTLENWKFWIFGLIFEPLMNSYNQTVSVASMDEMCRSSQLWVDQHCSLVELRPAVSNKLRQLSTTTDVLSDPPSSLQEEVLKAISTNTLLPGSSSSASGHCSRGSSTDTSPHRS
ncbi:histone-lysine N-methyltransferase 2D-like isoform X2 [Anopheles albimanus]|nr:histone-lysine N-methyltransferase 2D-like isoform X2 [Anopheles albimanus]